MTADAGLRHDSPSFEDVEAWVHDHLASCQAPGDRAIEDIAQVAPHPDGEVAACAVVIREKPLTPAHRWVVVVDLSGARATLLDVADDECARPAWSPDGSRLVVVASSDRGAAAVVLEGPPHGLAESTRSHLPGFVESADWSPDGSLLALQVAMPGAEISDVYGSGTLGGTDGEPWRPRVLPNVGGGRRLAYVWDASTAEGRQVSDANVWELAWSGSRALLALTSEDTDEGAWYGAVLSRLPLEGGGRDTLFVPEEQVSVPRSSPSGRRWSVLSGLQSDRGLSAGDLVVGEGASCSPMDTRGIHVTDQRWLDESTVLLAGLRGLDSVYATLDVGSGSVEETWSGEETSGEYFPEITGLPDRRPLVVLESHRRPPTLGVLEADGFRPVLAAESPGTAYQDARAGATTSLTWTSSDGQEVQGLLTLPDSAGEDGRYPLVLQVHGGPTHAVRSTWAGRDPQVSCMVACGYAVLRPNPRGSTGRGSAFAEAVRGDMGGLDVDDVVSGVEHLVDTGVADPARLGIAGISYGGFLASWVPTRTDIFAASVARSPCTDWLLQHLTSNIAEFDRRFIRGWPLDPESQYVERSPLRQVDRIRTPMLLTAGLADLATPPSQAQVLYTALRERGVETQLVLYPQEGHGVRQPLALVDQCARMIGWFDRHLRRA
jgi:dipeptidyl aminopeptidase/acylaminoacyl peptidase